MILDIPTPFDYGAAGGGTLNETVAVQAALDAASQSPFRHCSLGGGVFLVTNVVIPEGVRLTGPGKLVQVGGVYNSVVTMPNRWARAVDFEIDGNRASQTRNNVGLVYGAEDLEISKLHVYNVSWDGISATNGAKRVRVESNHIHDTGRTGATINGADTEHITHYGNFVHDTAEAGIGVMGSTRHASFIGNHTKDTGGDGIAGYAEGNEHISASNNHIESPRNHGIHISGNHCTVSANDIENVTNGHGIFFRKRDVSLMTGGVIVGNNVAGVNPGSGIRVESTNQYTLAGNYVETGPTEQWGIYVLRASHGAITGNTVIGTGKTGGPGGDAGLLVSSSSHIGVAGNSFKGFHAGIRGMRATLADTVSANVSVGQNAYSDVMFPVYRNAEAAAWEVQGV